MAFKSVHKYVKYNDFVTLYLSFPFLSFPFFSSLSFCILVVAYSENYCSVINRPSSLSSIGGERISEEEEKWEKIE